MNHDLLLASRLQMVSGKAFDWTKVCVVQDESLITVLN